MRRENDDKDMRDMSARYTGRERDKGVTSKSDMSDIKEWETSEDDDIQEFLSRDYDVVSESRRRLQNRQNAARRGNRTTRLENVEERTSKRTLSLRKEDVQLEDEDSTSKKDSLYDKWLSIYNKHSMQILSGVLTVLAVILVVAIILTNPDGENIDSTADSSGVVSQASTDEGTTEDETKPVIECESKESDIHQLILGYIDAAYIKADMEAVGLVVDDTTNINVEKYKSRQKYIELYENIKCYKFDSAIENAYIIFVTYDTKLYNIETLAPSAETFIVKFDTAGKKYIIHNLTVGEELDSYIAGASKFAYTIEIRKEIEERLKQALAKDAELKKVYDLMLSTGSKSTEGATENTTVNSSTEQTTTLSGQ